MCNKESFMQDRCDGIDSFPIGMAYVPWQYWEDIYEADKGLQQGTIFMQLDKPYLGRKVVRK